MQPESLIIRPPSEWRSLLVRVTRGCAWNRCRFCGVYPALGEPGFSTRTVDEVKEDIDLLGERVRDLRSAFFGDADPLLIGVDGFVEIAGHLRRVFPEIERLTCYARSSTIWKLGEGGVRRLAEGGLDRVHIGLETGDRALLKLHRKGQSPEMVVRTGRWLKEAGIEVSYYVLLGLGGRDRWREHVDATAEVVNAVDPDFLRLRRLWLYGGKGIPGLPESPLWEEIRTGDFVPQTPEGTVLELRRLLERLDGVTSLVACDHANNYVNVEGRLPGDREAMLEEIDRFLSLPDSEREAHYRAVGSRM